jgi:hypothetical protein
MRFSILLIGLAISSHVLSQEMTPVPVASIGVGHELIGALGVPLGKTVSIVGTVVEGTPSHSKEVPPLEVRISHLQGKQLPQVLTLPLWSYQDYPLGHPLQMEVREDARYELVFTPSLSLDSPKEEGQQRLHTGLQILNFKKMK